MAAAALATAIPKDAGELWELYGDYLRGLVIKLGIPPQEANDVLGTIVMRLVEQDVLGMYKPDHISPHTGKPVTFRAFISAQVAVRVRGQRDKLGRQEFRESLICDSAVDDSGTKWVEVFGGQWWDDYRHLDEGEFVSRMRAWLALQPPRSAADRCDLVALFDELVAEVGQQGKVSRKQVCERFSIAPATATSWLNRLRSALQEAASRKGPAPQGMFLEVGGVSLSWAQVQSAIDILEAAKGNKVREPLTAARHPLDKAEAGWYHPFSKAEIKAYPELNIDPQTHKKPADRVKRAVMHRLSRLLAEAVPAETQVPVCSDVQSGLPEPEPPTPLDLIEAELWGLGATAAKVDHILGLARSLAVPAA